MAAYGKVYVFTKDLVNGVHNFTSNSFKVMLTNVAPTTASAVKADITEIGAGNGYSAGGTVSAMTVSTATGTAKVVAADVTFTAAGGSIGPFRYAVLYNDTPTSPADPLVGFFDYGSSITLASGQTFTVDFDGTAGIFTLA